MLSNVRQTLRQSPLIYGVLSAILPLLLGVAVGPLVGFGPCGPNVPSSVRIVVMSAGMVAVASPFVGCWLFWVSFRRRGIVTAVVGLPLICGSVFVCLYWFFILASAIMS
jgi:hypothetical protein